MRTFSEVQYEETKHTILKTALDICASEGFEGLTIEKVARRLGLTKPALYHYFKNKEALLVELTLQYLEAGNRDIARILSEPGLSHQERLRNLLEYYIIQGKEEPGYFYLQHHINNLLEVLTPSPEKERIRALSYQIPHTIMEFIQDGITEGAFTPMDPMTMGTLILSMLSGVLLHSSMPGIKHMPAAELSRMVSHIILQGVQP
ncbi:MAG: TetR/AcrR family transcriptional regulator [Treponemataceae bacterium]|nr:TetR/AcrR family transcriptional regulator [Treponemataceae bacterium]